MIQSTLMGNVNSFDCKKIAGNFVCAGSDTDSSIQAIKLQQTIQEIFRLMSEAGAVIPKGMTALQADGKIGLITSSGAQFILGILTKHAPPTNVVQTALSPDLSPEDAVRHIAQNSREISDWMRHVVETVPGAINPKPTLVEAKRRVNPMIAVLGPLAMIAGVGIFATILDVNKAV